jgi:hypothetical protein
MWKHHLFRFRRKRGHKPTKKKSRSESAEELRDYKAGRIDRTNLGKSRPDRSANGFQFSREAENSLLAQVGEFPWVFLRP